MLILVNIDFIFYKKLYILKLNGNLKNIRVSNFPEFTEQRVISQRKNI